MHKSIPSSRITGNIIMYIIMCTESILTDITLKPASSGVILSPNSLVSSCFDVVAIADSLGLEGNQTLVLNLSTNNEFAVLTKPRINITIMDNDGK